MIKNQMFYIKKVSIFIFIVILLAGCSKKSDDQTKKNKSIGILLANTEDQFSQEIIRGIESAKEQFQDVKISYVDGKYDSNIQNDQMQKLLDEKVGVIVMMPIDRESSQPNLETANNEGVPVISLNRIMVNQSIAETYIGPDDISIGEMQMKETIKAIKKKGNIVILSGIYGHEPQVRRTQGYENVLKDQKYIKILDEKTGKWDRYEAYELTKKMLTDNNNIDAIVCNDDEMAIGASRAVQQAELSDQIYICGVNATKDALSFIKEGILDMTIYQDGFNQGQQAIEIANKILNDEEVDLEYISPVEIVTQKNVDDFINKMNNMR